MSKFTAEEMETAEKVLTYLVKRTYTNLQRELKDYSFDVDCPSYDGYQALVDSLVIVNKEKSK